MGAPNGKDGVTATTTAVPESDTTPKDELDHEEETGGYVKPDRNVAAAVWTIVCGVGIPCIPVVVISAVLLYFIFHYEIETHTGYLELQLQTTQAHHTMNATERLLDIRHHRGKPAYYVHYNPSTITTIASWTGRVIPYLSSSIMALVAFFAARRIVVRSKRGDGSDLPTPEQLTILIGLLGGNGFGPPRILSFIALRTRKIVDSWFGIATTPAVITQLYNILVLYTTLVVLYRRPNTPRAGGFEAFGNLEYLTCNLHHDTNGEAYGLAPYLVGPEEATRLAQGPTKSNVIRNFTDSKGIDYRYLADPGMDNKLDFKANFKANFTFNGAVQTIDASTLDGGTDSPNGGSSNFQSPSVGMAFAPDRNLSSRVGQYYDSLPMVVSTLPGFNETQGAFDPNAAVVGSNWSYQYILPKNPLNFAVWASGYPTFDGKSVTNRVIDNPLLNDTEIFHDTKSTYWILGCETTVYDVTYTWVNGSVHTFNATPASEDMGGLISAPFAFQLGQAVPALSNLASKAGIQNTSIDLAESFAGEWSQAALAMSVGVLDPAPNAIEQVRNSTIAVARVPMIPLYLLLGFKAIYVVAVIALAIGAYCFTHPGETEVVKAQLSAKGLAAAHFDDPGLLQQNVVKEMQARLQTGKDNQHDPKPALQRANTAPAGHEVAAVPTDKRVGLVAQADGAWKLALIADGVWQGVKPIAVNLVAIEAAAGQMGTAGQVINAWNFVTTRRLERVYQPDIERALHKSMDPLTAFSLAANIIAVVDVAAKLVHRTWQISRTGAEPAFIEIEIETNLVRGLLGRLKPGLNASGSGLSPDDRDLIYLCEQSENVSRQLLKLLESCKAKQGTGKITIESFWRAVKSEWNEDAIKSLQDRLESINAKAHMIINQKYASKITNQLTNLEQQYQVLGMTHAADLGDIKRALDAFAQTGSQSNHVTQQLMLRAAEKGSLGRDFAVQAGILGQLRFEAIDRRMHELEQRPSHEKSYLWLEGSNPELSKAGQTPANFDAWLSSSEKLYWISGVAGSGKSTLMKYLYSTPATRTRLTDWAQQKQVLVAAYFFWEVGKVALLRTQEGLLRTLLFQILRQRPDLIAEVYSDLWVLFTDALPSGQSSLSSFAGSQVSFHVQHLLEKLEAACRGIVDRNCCLFLLIDGLDEYEGKPTEIIQLMNVLTGLPNVKICVSSRPDNTFLDAYAGMATKLYMEDFNTSDIREYVRDRLESHARFKDDEDRSTLGNDLINKVVDSSSGVFLWVRLVMEDLEEGLTDRNTIAQLQRRLDRLPKELERFFDHMLNKVNEEYRKDSASILLITYHANDLLPPLSCWFITEGSPELDDKKDISATDLRSNNKRRDDLDSRLRGYCRGLLIIQDLPLDAIYNALPSSSLFGQKVNFLHRTVREFLTQASVTQRLDAWKPDDFDADVLICKAIRAQIRTSPVEVDYFAADGPIAGLLRTFAFHYERLHGQSAQNTTARDLRCGLAEILSAQAKVNGHGLSVRYIAVGQATNSDTQPKRPTELIRRRQQEGQAERFWKGT
ncbi:hypothetical protein LTS10_009655 [Elasticomyces elasticus]|nr:hypothetical protein LTS10_009655 [Elasticomyces elasticus]